MVRISKILTVAFLDAYLKGDETARAKLNADYASSLAGKVVKRVEWEAR